ncbi:hypothetical protein [Streptomyces sp. NPDC050355]|uniref:hypothetical protein n=1 Tax=Streptomyces sp. NPDC050355 TaxID=3365609 RepID=UPI003794FEED
MNDHQPQDHQAYPSHDPYAQPDPYAQQARHSGHPPHDAPQAAYGDPYGQQAYDPYAQQPQPPQPGHDPYGRGHYGYEAYEQQPQQPAAPQQHYGQLPAQHQSAPPAEEPYAHQHPPARPAPAAAAAAAVATAPVDTAHLAPNQRARAEGRSPIIPPGIQPAALTAVLAALLALTAPLGRPALAVPVALLQAVTAAGWFRLNGMWPARQGIALAFLAGLTTDAALLATDRESAPLVGIGTLGVWCLLVLILQLRNRSSADERMYALTAGLTSTALAVLAAGHLAASGHAVSVGAAAVAVATLARALPMPSAVSIGVALVAAAGAGIGAGQLTGLGASGALLGLAAGGCALIGLRVASYDYPSRFVHMTAGVALPLALAAPAVYVLGRALGH